MANDEATTIFGALSIVETVILLFIVWYVGIKTLRKRINRADAFYKAVIKTHGRQSFDQIMRMYNANHEGAVDDNATLDLMVKKYHDTPLKEFEDTNKHYGSYSASAGDIVNDARRRKYYHDTDGVSEEELDRQDLIRKTARLAALQRVIRRREAAVRASEERI
jgi:hypothetical protein